MELESSPPRADTLPPPIAGVKRPASLLPAFEPSSSPSLPRPYKRLARESGDDVSTYPTPVPTSSTAILTSSPPRRQAVRPGLKRTLSVASERAPLSTVPSIMLPLSGEPILMGRSSGSCHFQLSASRLISRIHVQATYKPSTNPFDRDRIEILCTGWNGIKLHCQGKTYELNKGKTFTSDIKDADVMIDVQDARVLVQWPRHEPKDSASTSTSDQTWEESSPVRKPGTTSHPLQASPLRSRGRLASPISPSPAVQALQPPEPPLLTPSRSVHSAVVVYEDEPSPTRQKDSKSISQLTEVVSSPFHNENLRNSMSSSCDDKAEELSEHDEENDPIIHSFGPFGDNILPRMASFNTGMSPVRSPVNIRKPAVSPRQHTAASKPVKTEDDQHSLKQNVQNHVVNQLAFSRLSSTPLSTIISHLPPELWKKTPSGDGGFSSLEIKSIIGTIACIGEVSREGKDAAGKPLESEYYYIPDLDEDEKRKEAVVNDLMKPGLRSCRKQHKRYYWRKPK
ncbi:conserved hypothetical protein [Histoplasma capsulatum G186AR]|uniref:FHA domain-containing protein n=2 Tax=Ajellomyces capsulatus TaxID=5037 RepID=C0ND41_AJECG|nr:uncharacterized protein HCBG_01037 [Histoplasma capsulatum G186AR]EEH11582.1 conserved hypothetical protein [Histoplasma capsulatum G186AR]KAG5302578.1 transcription factor Tos4 [Histoplasma capsulatum]QSS72022.1 transcription factor Tos4 [Histoplasma capsulatum G186AR]